MIPATRFLPRQTELPLLVTRPMAFARRYWAGLLVLLAGAAVDGVSTFICLRQYGPGCELHTVQRWMSLVLGVTWGVPLAKIAQAGFAVLVAAWWRPWCRWILIGCGLLYASAGLANHFMLL